MAARKYDLVVFGATGFTGKLVAEYLTSRFGVAGAELKWTIAGRSTTKLAAVRAGLALTEEPIVADVGSAESLRAMCRQTRVIVTTVGPFALYGEGLVAACVAESTDYADITGEAHFVRNMIDRHHAEARDRGVRIVSMAGYDSIPSDIGSLVAVAEYAKLNQGQTPRSVKSVAGKSAGGVSGGTMASIFNILENESWATLKRLGNPYILCPGLRNGPDAGQQLRPRWEADAAESQLRPQWSSFFVMSSVNASVVRRSQFLRREASKAGEAAAAAAQESGEMMYGYDESMGTGKGCAGITIACVLSLIPFFGGAMMVCPPLRWLAKALAPAPGEGPSKEAREGGCFNHHVMARGEEGSTIQNSRTGTNVGVKFSCPFADPGYKGTALMLASAGVSLALDPRPQAKSEPPVGAATNGDAGAGGGFTGRLGGGVLTPSVALGMPFVERLKAEGIQIDVKSASG